MAGPELKPMYVGSRLKGKENRQDSKGRKSVFQLSEWEQSNSFGELKVAQWGLAGGGNRSTEMTGFTLQSRRETRNRFLV